MLGFTLGHQPKFAKRFAELGDHVRGAMQHYVEEVRERRFPGPEHCYKPNASPKAKLTAV
jgi:3-methyl-2-oxobutanoate hydroxymethyltransferase